MEAHTLTEYQLHVVNKWPRASFQGKNNLQKSRVFVLFWMREQYDMDDKPLTVKEIHKFVPRVKIEYLHNRLASFVRWRYLNVHYSKVDQRVKAYSLAARGRRFVEDRLIVLNRELYDEIWFEQYKVWQAQEAQ